MRVIVVGGLGGACGVRIVGECVAARLVSLVRVAIYRDL